MTFRRITRRLGTGGASLRVGAMVLVAIALSESTRKGKVITL
jgi:hypothetical protein